MTELTFTEKRSQCHLRELIFVLYSKDQKTFKVPISQTVHQGNLATKSALIVSSIFSGVFSFIFVTEQKQQF